MLVKREYEGKVETLESSMCQYDAKADVMRVGWEEKIRELEKEKSTMTVSWLKAEEECKDRGLELTKVRAERDEGIAAAKSKDAGIRRLEYVPHTSL